MDYKKIKKKLLNKYSALSLFLFSAFFPATQVLAHGVTVGDQGFIQESSGILFSPFVYLGAKHMITGYDHILFLLGIIFFLYKMKEVWTYVTIFALSHITTLLIGVYFDLPVNAYIVDAIIGLSVVYKAFDNIGGFSRMGININTKVAVGVFGLFHGLGLATKLQDFELAREGLFWNLISFNIGVEIGQILALAAILIAMGYWRRSKNFGKSAYVVNILMMVAGFGLMGYQLIGFFIG